MLFLRNDQLVEALESKGVTVADMRMAGLTQFQAQMAVQGFLAVTKENAHCFQKASGIPECTFLEIEKRFNRKRRGK